MNLCICIYISLDKNEATYLSFFNQYDECYLYKYLSSFLGACLMYMESHS